MLRRAGWSFGSPLASDAPAYLAATTACLAGIVVCQAVNVLLCRHSVRPALSFGLRANPLILWALAAEALLIVAIVYTPIGHLLFGTAPLDAQVWVFLVPFAALMFAAEETRKALVRRAARTSTE